MPLLYWSHPEYAQDRYLLMDYKKDNDTFFGWIDYLMDTLETTDLASWFIGKPVKECHRCYLDYMREEMIGSKSAPLPLPNFSKRVQHEFRLTTHRPKNRRPLFAHGFAPCCTGATFSITQLS